MGQPLPREGRPRPVERVVALLQQQGRKVTRHGDSWKAQCPAHDDQHSSLSICEGRQGQALLKCHAGCRWQEIAAALGLEVRELFVRSGDQAYSVSRSSYPAKSKTGLPLPDTQYVPRTTPERLTYDYRDRSGALVYQVVRTPAKRFWIRRPDGSGGWQPGLGAATRVPYRLPELLAAPPDRLVYVVEGEKDVETLRACGLIASTNLGGAGKWRHEYSAYFQSRRVVVLPDNDAPGRAHAANVVASLHAAGVEVVLLALPGLPPKGDVSDWLQAGNRLAHLEALARQALAALSFVEPPPVEEIPREGQGGQDEAAGGKVGPAPDPVPPLRPAALSVSRCLRGDSCAVSAVRAVSPGGVSTPLPEPLEPEALHGIAGEIVRAIEPHTEAHPAALLVTLLAALGSLIGPGPHARVGPSRHMLKLFAVIFGPTAKGRKGTSEEHVRALLRAVDPDWEQLRIFSGTSSGEGIIHHVRDSVEVEERDAKTREVQRVVKDPGVSDKRLLIIESEFAQLLKVMSREGNTVSPVVRLAWDDKPLQNPTKNSPAIATGSHISLLGHSTQEELLRYLNRTEAGNGFGNRFLWVWATRSKALPFPTEVPGLNALADSLREIVRCARWIDAVEWGAATRPLWAAVYVRLSEGRTGLFGAVTSRAEAQVLRLSTLYAVLDGSATIQPPHLLAALALWRYCEASARYLFGDSTGDPLADTILENVRQCPAGVTRLEIRDLLHRHCSSERLTRLLDRLVVEGLLRREKRTDTGGRPAELLLPTEAARAGGDDPLDLARRLAPERSEGCAESAVTGAGLTTLPARCAANLAAPSSPAEEEEELASPWEPPTDQDLDRALDQSFDPDPEEEDERAPDPRATTGELPGSCRSDALARPGSGAEGVQSAAPARHSPEIRQLTGPTRSEALDDDLPLDLGAEEDEPEDDGLALAAAGGVPGWRHEEL